MARRTNGLSTLLAGLQDASKTPAPLVNYLAPEKDTEAVDLFARARAGEAGAAADVRKLIVQREWLEWIGNVAAQAGRQLVAKATAGDAVWKAGIEEKMLQLWRELGGADGSMLEKLLIRRVLNGWLAVHLLELQQAMRPPAAIKEREYLDRAVSRAQKRYTEAITALARIRRLNVPLVLARVNITGQRAPELRGVPSDRMEQADTQKTQ